MTLSPVPISSAQRQRQRVRAGIDSDDVSFRREPRLPAPAPWRSGPECSGPRQSLFNNRQQLVFERRVLRRQAQKRVVHRKVRKDDPSFGSPSSLGNESVLRPIFLFGSRQSSLDLFDSLFVRRMSAGNSRRAAASGLAIVFPKSLPKSDPGPRVVTGPRHVDQPPLVRLRFMRSAVGQHNSQLCSETIHGRRCHLSSRVGARQAGAQHISAGLAQQLLAYPLSSVARHRMGDLMPNHCCQPGLVFGDRQ